MAGAGGDDVRSGPGGEARRPRSGAEDPQSPGVLTVARTKTRATPSRRPREWPMPGGGVLIGSGELDGDERDEATV